MMKSSERIKKPIDLGKTDEYMRTASDAGELLKAKYLADTGFSDPKLATLVYILDEMHEEIQALKAKQENHA